MKRFTVLMPTYNAELYISAAIDSVLCQKVNFEYQIIIIDDKSTDNSLKIAEKYQYEHPDKIKILKNDKNLKLLKTIIIGYENTKTEFFCVLDPDDYWIDEYKMQKAVDFLDQNKDFTMYSTNTCVLHSDGTKRDYIGKVDSPVDSDYTDYLQDKVILGCSLGVVFRNVIFKHGVPKKLYQFVNSKYGQSFRADSYRNVIHLYEGKSHYVGEVDSVYRFHGNGLWSGSSNFKRNVLNLKFYLGMYKYLEDERYWDYVLKRLDIFYSQLNETKDLILKEDIGEQKYEIVEMIDLIIDLKFECEKHGMLTMPLLPNTGKVKLCDKLYLKIYNSLKKRLNRKNLLNN